MNERVSHHRVVSGVPRDTQTSASRSHKSGNKYIYKRVLLVLVFLSPLYMVVLDTLVDDQSDLRFIFGGFIYFNSFSRLLPIAIS